MDAAADDMDDDTDDAADDAADLNLENIPPPFFLATDDITINMTERQINIKNNINEII